VVTKYERGGGTMASGKQTRRRKEARANQNITTTLTQGEDES
jgi:hypothetical protein